MSKSTYRFIQPCMNGRAPYRLLSCWTRSHTEGAGLEKKQKKRSAMAAAKGSLSVLHALSFLSLRRSFAPSPTRRNVDSMCGGVSNEHRRVPSIIFVTDFRQGLNGCTTNDTTWRHARTIFSIRSFHSFFLTIAITVLCSTHKASVP